jgi:hypothetical protein
MNIHVALGENMQLIKNPNDLMCINPECINYLERNMGNIFVKEYKGKNKTALLICKTCGKCFSETHGTPLFRLKTSLEELARVLSLIPKLGTIRAVARYTNHKPDTILAWINSIGDDKKIINDYLSTNYRYSKVQLDEIWSLIESRRRKNIETNQ